MNEYQKEKEALTNFITQLEDCMAEGRGKIFNKDAKEAYKDNKILRNACKLSLKLINLATPMKPVLHDLFNDVGDGDDFVFDENGNLNDSYVCCPNCKQQDIYDFEYGVRFKHCSNCGQAIEWSE